MAKTPSTMVELGTTAPAFALPDTVTGKSVSLDQLASQKGTLVMFICNHCPFVHHVEDQLVSLARDYIAKGISVIAISANDVQNYPDDAPDKMQARAAKKGYPFPYLYDESQVVAKAYDAACTPDFFLFDGELTLVYRGQLDESRPGNGIPVTGTDLRAALDSLLAGRPISPHQKPSLGCNIKWKAAV